MTVRDLGISGAWEITPDQHRDDRGLFYEWFTQREFTAVTGYRLDIHQANCSVSDTGVLRGMHFVQVPPGQAKYVTCVRGELFDVVVDVRVGSPTYGRWVSTTLDDRDRRSVYIADGLAHGFYALQDNTTVAYLCSTPYTPDREHTVNALDLQLAIDWPVTEDVVMSERDRAAPTLEQLREAGVLPTWEENQAYVAGLREG
ncbi:MAG: dTDP-4-dehydrorhamnose 3,5-epimerase [Mycobacterium sp.]|jgi:dTDP-4-dehydrorhamnose 3,5-epimerase|nr:dTDP-4-dehydrorhamnose 3,5-epimerase [Mycobacterium sp.]